MVGSKCGGVGPAPDPDSPLAADAAEAAVAGAAAAWERFAPHEGLAATWRLIGAANSALEATEPWKMEPGPDGRRRPRQTRSRRSGSWPCWPARPCPPRRPRSGAASGSPGRPEDLRVPDDTAWGRYPGGLPVVQGDPLFPRRKD